MNELGNSTGATHPDVRISATNFGPIASSTVDLRPLTVFVGPSNTGKTYFATLIYALHRILGGFPRLPSMRRYRHPFFQGLPYGLATDAEAQQELQDFLKKLATKGRMFRFSDLPRSVRDAAQAAVSDPDFLGEFLQTELRRCFDLESVSGLVRFSGQSNRMEVALAISEQEQDLWGFRMESTESGVITDGRIADRFHGDPSRWIDSVSERETHYLPAARSGTMQSHRLIASALVARSPHARMEHFPELPTLSGVMADFMQHLILYEEHRSTNPSVNALAEVLEREVLAGQIRTRRSLSGGFLEFVYRPRATSSQFRWSSKAAVLTHRRCPSNCNGARSSPLASCRRLSGLYATRSYSMARAFTSSNARRLTAPRFSFAASS